MPSSLLVFLLFAVLLSLHPHTFLILFTLYSYNRQHIVCMVCVPLYHESKVPSPCIGAIAFRSAHFGQGSSSIPILLNNVRCTGSEEGLLLCRYGSTTSSCSHSRDASVQCQYPGKRIDSLILMCVSCYPHIQCVKHCLYGLQVYQLYSQYSQCVHVAYLIMGQWSVMKVKSD